MTPQPQTCGDCREKRTGDAPPYTEIVLCPRHAAADDLYEAAKAITNAYQAKCDDWDQWCGRADCSLCGNGAALIESARAAIAAYEGK